MRSILKSKSILLIFSVALFIRLFFAFTGNDIPTGDEIFYEEAGRNISLGNGYLQAGHLTASKTPGYPIFVGLIYRMFGKSLIPIRILQALIDALMCVLVYMIAIRFFDRRVAFLSGVLCAFHYFFLKSLQVIRPDTVQMFFIVLSILFWIRWRTNFFKKDAFFLGAALSFTVMLKANMILLPFLIIAIEGYNFIKDKKIKFKIFSRSVLLLVFIFSLPLIAWSIRNYNAFNSFVPVATDGGLALYSSYNPPEGKKFGILTSDSVTTLAYRMDSEVERSKYLSKKTVEHIVNHPKEVLALMPLKILFFWSVFDWETLGDENGVYNFATGFILPFSFLGMFFLRKRFKEIYPIIWPIVYAFSLAIIFAGIPRFRMAVEPFLIIFSAYAMTFFYDRYSKRMVALFILSWFFFNFYMFTDSSCIFLIGKSTLRCLKLW